MFGYVRTGFCVHHNAGIQNSILLNEITVADGQNIERHFMHLFLLFSSFE